MHAVTSHRVQVNFCSIFLVSVLKYPNIFLLLHFSTLPTFNVIRNPGSVSINAEVCKGTPEDIAQFVSGFVSSMLSTVCGGPCDNVGIENVSICGQRIDQDLTNISGRRLQDGRGTWQATYELVTTTLCGAAGCASGTDTENANTIANRVADIVRNAIQSGSFASTLSSNSDVVASLGSSALSCLVAWGTMHGATTTLTDISGDPVSNDPVSNANVTHPYYPVRTFVILIIYQSYIHSGANRYNCRGL